MLYNFFMKVKIPFLLVSIVAVLMLCSIFVQKGRSQIKEARELPYYTISMDQVQDGTYTSSSKTSFMHLTLEITVLNHKIEKINIIENEGSKGLNAAKIIDDMILNNKPIVPVVKSDELGSLVFISTATNALRQGYLETLNSEQ
jgi:uncharacterized protein with FMN-binding domain